MKAVLVWILGIARPTEDPSANTDLGAMRDRNVVPSISVCSAAGQRVVATAIERKTCACELMGATGVDGPASCALNVAGEGIVDIKIITERRGAEAAGKHNVAVWSRGIERPPGAAVIAHPGSVDQKVRRLAAVCRHPPAECAL